MTDTTPVTETREAKEAKLVQMFVNFRDQRKALKADFTEKDNGLKQNMERIEAYFLGRMQEGSGVNGIKTDYGSVSASDKVRYIVEDRAQLNTWILGEGNLDVLNRSVNQSRIKDYALDNDGQLPAGVTYQTERTITITRPRKK